MIMNQFHSPFTTYLPEIPLVLFSPTYLSSTWPILNTLFQQIHYDITAYFIGATLVYPVHSLLQQKKAICLNHEVLRQSL